MSICKMIAVSLAVDSRRLPASIVENSIYLILFRSNVVIFPVEKKLLLSETVQNSVY